jgi:catalase
VAILVADGVDGDAVAALAERMTREGAVARIVGARLGTVRTAQGGDLTVDVTAETTPSVLYDAVAIPGGTDSAAYLARWGHAEEFVKDQYRHCKAILALGAATGTVQGYGIPAALPDGAPDTGFIVNEEDEFGDAIDKFVSAIAAHRHFARQTDPPTV